jgi:hypothetical protein
LTVVSAASLAYSLRIHLRLLSYAVDDDLFLHLFADLASLIRRSEEFCRAAGGGPDDDGVCDAETDYIEELLGSSFVILQAKIRRVAAEAVRFQGGVNRLGVPAAGFDDQPAVRAFGPEFPDAGATVTQLVWDVANYFKHRDEWRAEAFDPPPPGKRPTSVQATWQGASRTGMKENSATGNMRTAYAFFGIDPFSDCERLAEMIQEWALTVRRHAERQIHNHLGE